MAKDESSCPIQVDQSLCICSSINGTRKKAKEIRERKGKRMSQLIHKCVSMCEAIYGKNKGQ